jgi:hypothetical protein
MKLRTPLSLAASCAARLGSAGLSHAASADPGRNLCVSEQVAMQA